MKDWFKRSFGSDYMVVYKHRDWKQATREVETMAGWLGLPAGAAVLDIGCGMGRHARAMAKLGYRVTGIDLSAELLRKAADNNADGMVDRFIQGDMRRLPFENASFQATVNLFTSFGYFAEEADNERVLHEIRRVLRPDGRFLIDFLNPAYVRCHLVPHSERTDEESGLIIQENRSVEDDWVVKRIDIREAATGDNVRRYVERVRLLPLAWFERQLQAAGLGLDTVYGGYDGSPYHEAASARMIMTGRVLK